MLTWGLDWATEAGDRGAVLIEWTQGSARVVDVRRGAKRLKDDQVLELLVDDDVTMTAVDVPFGWPVDFHAFLRAHEFGPVSSLPSARYAAAWRIDRAARRETDRAIMARLPGVTPLAVSFALLGATSASWAVIEAELDRCGHRLDRSGLAGRIVETYPTAVRAAVSDLSEDGRERPPRIDLNGHEVDYDASPHVRDAYVAAVAARARAIDESTLPAAEVVHLARVEGWIHAPTPGLSMAELVSG